jgi:nucleoside-diphosphate-sugar epimerase
MKVLVGDVRIALEVEKAIQGFDSVVHLAGLVGAGVCESDLEEALRVNCTATRNVLRACQKSYVERLVFASSCSVYGDAKEIVSETSPPNPVDLYAKTKLASENDLLTSCLREPIITIMRMGTVFGVSPRMRFDLFVNLLVAKACTEKKITVRGGHQWRPIVHVQDVGRAYIMALEANKNLVSGQIFNVGSNELNVTKGEVGEKIKMFVPDTQVTYDPSDDMRDYKAEFSKIRTTLGFKPEISLEQGIEEIVEEFKHGKFADWKTPQYTNFRSDLSEYFKTIAKSKVTT